MSGAPGLLTAAALAVVGLIILVARLRIHAFIALVIASLFVGVATGMAPDAIVRAFQEGVGGTLGFIAVVIGLGTVLGRLLEVSGGAEVVAGTIVRALGQHRLPWAVALTAFVIGIPVFFSVGLVLLLPVVIGLATAAGRPFLGLGLPLVAALSVSHGLVPPHPGPLTAIERLDADTGRTIVYAVLTGIPALIVAGPIYGPWILRRLPALPPPPLAIGATAPPPGGPPSFVVTLGTVLLPVLLMLAGTIAETSLAEGGWLRTVITFVGSPLVAMLIAVLAALATFGLWRGFDGRALLRLSEECLGPVASVLLVVGAGGGFGRVLAEAGVGSAIAAAVAAFSVPPLVFGWLVAALLRVSVGSATVAITTAASLVAPLVDANPSLNRELLVVSMGAGSIIASHVNDGGFWLVKEYFGLSVPQTLMTWTAIETLIAVVSLVMVLVLGALGV
jgi:gluconate:H+ symporter, GntP family